jgi:hypothetical protein
MSFTKKDSELCVLGSILADPKCFNYVQQELATTDFLTENHRAIYEAFRNIKERNEPIEPVTLANELKANKLFERIGGGQYIGELIESSPGSASIKYHVKEVKEAAIQQSLHIAFHRGIDGLKGGESSNKIIGDIALESDRLRNYLQKDTDYMGAQELLDKEFEKGTDVIGNGILPNGGGLILAGESGIGKSILRTEIGIHLAMGWELWGLPVTRAWKVLIVQFENPEPTEQYRLRQMMRGFNITNLKGNLRFSNPTIRINLTLKTERPKALALVQNSGADVVIFDPLSSIHSSEADKKYFTHGVVVEDILGNPEKIAEILGGLGGEVGKQAELIDAIMKDLVCGLRTAKSYIKNAIGKTIQENKEENSKFTGYSLID